MIPVYDVSGNRLLDALPPDIRERLRLGTVALNPNRTIHEPGASAEHVFFPTAGLISMIAREAQAHPALLGLLLRYSQVILTTAAQTAACNRLHLLEQRFARWLLSAHDRAETDTFPMTQEFSAMMLGVRRPGVTIAAQAFEADGMIAYNHGTMTIVDRAGLETASCDCYPFIQSEFKRLLGRSAGE